MGKGFPAGLPRTMLSILQLYFQNLMRLSSPNWFHHITPLSETWFSLHQIPGASFQISCSPCQSNWSHSHMWHARSCLSTTLLFLNTWLPPHHWLESSSPSKSGNVPSLHESQLWQNPRSPPPRARSLHWTPAMPGQTSLQVMMYFNTFYSCLSS